LKNYKDKLSQIKSSWRRLLFSAIVTSLIAKEYIATLKPVHMVAPASILIVINTVVSLGLRESIFSFFFFTLVIIALATSPMLFQSPQAHWVGANRTSRYFNDVIVLSGLQLVLSAQSYILAKDNTEAFMALLFASYLISLILLFVFKSYLWVRFSKTTAGSTPETR
jgi:hypothetical protein